MAKKKKKTAKTKKKRIAIAIAKVTKKPRVVKKVSDRKRTGDIINRKRDAARKALPPGWRISKNGRLYYEARRNRSDIGRI